MHEPVDGINSLSNSLIKELTGAVAMPRPIPAAQIIRLVFGRAARRFAELGLDLDRVIERDGTAAGARWLLPRFTKSFLARGQDNIPLTGPLVIASNHPGSIDSLVISAFINRPDYKIIIGDIPFFQNLPHVSEHAIFAPGRQNMHGRMQVIRESIRHLASGGALLIFARGGIEPDPAFMPAPGAEFSLWSQSLRVFLERVPQTRVLVTIISGVISQITMNHPFTRLRLKRPDRQRLAFMLQMARQVISGKETYGLTPRVSFGELLGLHQAGQAECIPDHVSRSARDLLEDHLMWQQESPYANI